MTEAYKGLVIKIGGDTSELQKSLKASNSAIRTTQAQLRELEKAAHFNSSGTRLMSLQLETMRDKAQALNVKFRTLNEVVQKMGTAKVRELSALTKDASYNAEKLKADYAGVCDQIKRFKNQISAAASASGLLEKEFGIKEFDVNKISTDPFRGLEGDVNKVVDVMKKLGATEEQVNHYTKNLVTEYNRLRDAMSLAKEAAQFKDLQIKMATAKAEARELASEMTRMQVANPAVTRTEEFQKLVNELKQAGTEANELRNRLQGLDTAMNLDPKNIEVAKAKLRTMQEQIENNTERMRALQSQLNAMKASGIDKIANDTTNLGAKLRTAENELTELNIKMAELRAQNGFDAQAADAKELASRIQLATERVNQLSAAQQYRGISSNLASITAETNSLNNSMKSALLTSSTFRGTLQNVGWSLTGTVTPAAQMFAMYAVQAADEVDTSYRNMRKTVQGTEEQFENLKAAALDYSRTHVTSADTILEIEALGGQLGVATSRLEEFATTVSNLEIATNLDAETAATQLGQLSGILNDMTDRDFAKYGDALTRLGNNSATLESNISDVMLRIASMGTITGFSTTELLAWSTAIASTGQGAEAAGTAISKTMSNIETAVGKGGEDLEGFAKVAGMSAQEFANAWKSDPSSAMQAFVQGLKNIENSGGSADSTLVSLGITAVRQKQALLGLTQTVDQLNDDLQMSANAWNGVDDEWGEAGDAAREAQRKAEGFSGALQLLKNNAQAFGVEIGDSVRPMIEALADVVEKMTSAYSNSPAAVKSLINVLILLTATAGPALVAISAIINMINTLKTTVAAQATLSAAASAMGIAKNAAAALLPYLQLVGKEFAANGVKAGVSAAQTIIASNAMKVATTATKLLKVALSALPWVAVGMLVTEFIGILNNYNETCQKNKAATDGMKEALATIKGSAQEATVAYKDSIEDIIESAQSARDSQAELADSIKSSFADVQTNEGLLDNYIAKIEELAGHCDGSASNYTVLKQAVDGYNEITGESVKITDSITGTLSTSTAELKKNAEMWKVNAEAQAYQEAYTDVLKQRIKNEANLKSTTDKLAESEDKYIKIGNVGIAKVWGKELDQLRSLADSKEQLEEQNETLKETEEALAQGLQDANNKLAQYTDSSSNAASEADILAGKLNLTTDEFSSLVEETTSAISSNEGLQEFFNQTGLSVSEFAYALSEAGVSASDLGQSIEDMKSKTQNAFEEIEEQAAVTADQMIATLEHNIEVTQNWATNLQSLYKRAGDGAGRSLVDSIAAKGPEYASTVQALLDSDDSTWNELIAKWQESGSAAVTAGAAGMGLSADQLKTAGENAKQQAVSGMTTTTEDGQNAMAGLIEGVDYTLSTASSGASQAGADAGQSYASGVSSKTGEASTAASGLANASESEIQGMKDTAWQIGAASGSNYAVGIWSKTGESSNAGGDVARSAIDALSQYGGVAWQWGAHMGSNFAAGLWSKTGEASSAAAAVARAAADQIKHTVPRKGVLHNGGKGEKPWGEHLVQNFVAGITAEIPEMSKTIAKLSSVAAESLASGRYQAGIASSVNAARDSVVSVNVNMANIEAPLTQWLESNLPIIIAQNAPNLVIDNDAGQMIVDTRLTQLRGKVMNYG